MRANPILRQAKVALGISTKLRLGAAQTVQNHVALALKRLLVVPNAQAARQTVLNLLMAIVNAKTKQFWLQMAKIVALKIV
jgi:hypothetical protein